MTMFSMKPKFNLAEFLAVPAPAGKSRNTRRRGMPFRPDAESDDAAAPAPSGDAGPGEQAKD
jgi:hypothetical protein